MRLATMLLGIGLTCSISLIAAEARDIRYKKTVTLRVGQTTTLKGVRSHNCGDRAPSWSEVRGGLPRSRTGSFSNGGAGTVKSRSCGGRVGARGVRFTAKRPGRERLRIYNDYVRITVR